MFIDLVDALRCPRPHASTWLVAAAYETAGRCIVRGSLGCPTCEGEYVIAGGVALFDGGAGVADGARGDALEAAEDASEAAVRAAALLDLTTPGGIVALGGRWSRAVDALAALADVRILAVEPPDAWTPREPAGAVRGALLPVAAGALRGVALDAATATPERLAAAVDALRPRGRVLAPAGVPLPDGVRELARDDRHWLAEREGAPATAPIALRRAGG